ncbi:hypothetical protein ACCO45_005238 [Purpureocillium lilacinum]
MAVAPAAAPSASAPAPPAAAGPKHGGHSLLLSARGGGGGNGHFYVKCRDDCAPDTCYMGAQCVSGRYKHTNRPEMAMCVTNHSCRCTDEEWV